MRIRSSFEATYLADLVILLRYFEAQGTVRQAISIVKNRSRATSGPSGSLRWERTGSGSALPLTKFQGVLTGNPEFSGGVRNLDSRSG